MSDRRKCPECGVSVKVENLAAHFKKIHPRARLDAAIAAESERKAKAHRPRRAATSSEKKVYVASAIVILVILGVALGIQQLSRPATPPTGQTAPDFGLSTVSGGTFQLSAFRGHVVLLDFFSTSCQFCQQFTRDTLIPLNAQYSSRFVLISIDINREGDGAAGGNTRISAYMAAYGATWQFALDVNRVVSQTYGITGTPTHFIVDANGFIVDRHEGTESREELVARLSLYW